MPPLRTVSLADLTIDDEPSFRHVGLYADLKQILLDDEVKFRVPAAGARLDWPRALFLNLTMWSRDVPSDVLTDTRIDADVVAHTAWHHLARLAFADHPVSSDVLFLGESIASAFDLYLVGRLLGNAPDAAFLETQIPALADAADSAGLSDSAFEALLQSIAADPERAFEDLRSLLFDAGTTLVHAATVDDAAAALDRSDAHRFAPFLHHYELSNWILHARVHAADRLAPDPAVRSLDAQLRAAPASIDWLEAAWVRGHTPSRNPRKSLRP